MANSEHESGCKDGTGCRRRNMRTAHDIDDSTTVSEDECGCGGHGESSSFLKRIGSAVPIDTKDCVQEWHPRPQSATYWIGYLAGLAGGEIDDLRDHPAVVRITVQYSLAFVFSILSLTIGILMLPLIVFNSIHYLVFWALSIHESYQMFRSRLGRRRSIYQPPPDPAQGLAYDCDPTRWTCDPYKGKNRITDCCFVLYTVFLLALKFVIDLPKWRRQTTATPTKFGKFKVPEVYAGSPTVRSIKRARSYVRSPLLSRMLYFFKGQWLVDHINLFRQHLAQYPPDFPVSCHDKMFYFDEEKSRFQLCMLFIVDKLSFEEVAEAFRRRWTNWEPKTRGVVGRRWGKSCWRVQRETFDLNNHIIHKRVDLTTTTVAEIVSAMGSEEIPQNQPQWQVWYLDSTPSHPSQDISVDNPSASGIDDDEETSYVGSRYIADAAVAATSNDTSKLSYIIGKWAHVFADGSGMMAGIVSRLGDNAVSIDNLPENYRRQVPAWQAVIYYAYHGCMAALRGLRIWCYWSFAHPESPALLQANLQKCVLPYPTTGRKYYSAPGVFDMSDINTVRRGIQQETGIRPTVNDIFASCISYAWGQLSDPVELDSVVRNKLNLPPRRKGAPPLVAANRPANPTTLQTIIPMMVRTGVPTRMDNFTSLVNVSLPIPQRQGRPDTVLAPREYSSRPPTPVTQPGSPQGGDRASTPLGVASHLRKKPSDVRPLHSLDPTAPAASVVLVKKAIDKIKCQKLREVIFLMTCSVCKAFPSPIARKLFLQMFKYVQVCSTNVAAPSIESRFFGREVRGLFFWPAVPSTMNLGTSIVSLGKRFQLLTVLDESEVLPAVDVAKRIFEEERMIFGEEECQEVLDVMSDILVSLVVDRFHTLKTTYRHLAIPLSLDTQRG